MNSRIGLKIPHIQFRDSNFRVSLGVVFFVDYRNKFREPKAINRLETNTPNSPVHLASSHRRPSAIRSSPLYCFVLKSYYATSQCRQYLVAASIDALDLATELLGFSISLLFALLIGHARKRFSPRGVISNVFFVLALYYPTSPHLFLLSLFGVSATDSLIDPNSARSEF